MEKKDPIEEARRYVDNAMTLLTEHGELDPETRLYADRKYVKMAGNTLWNGMLLILDALFHVKTKRSPHPDIKDYKEAVGSRDRKLLAYVNTGYDTMHISMGYDGNQSKATCDEGFRIANNIIERCALLFPNP